MGGSAPTAPLLASTGRALVHAILKLALYGVALAAGLLLTAVTGVGGFVGVALAGLFLARIQFALRCLPLTLLSATVSRIVATCGCSMRSSGSRRVSYRERSMADRPSPATQGSRRPVPRTCS